MDAEALRAIADGVSLKLDTVQDAEASAVALQAKLRDCNTTGAPAEVAGEFDAGTDKPRCASAAATTATSRAASSRKTSCTAPTTPPWPKPPKPSVACWPKAPR